MMNTGAWTYVRSALSAWGASRQPTFLKEGNSILFVSTVDMKMKKQVRMLLSSVVATMLALPLVGVNLAPSVAKADAPGLVINEINWAGSPSSSNDQWVELYNNEASTIDFSLHPYSLYNGTTSLATINSGTLNSGGYLVLSRLGSASSSLKVGVGAISVNHFLVEPSLVLPTKAMNLILKDDSDVVVDMVDDGAGMPMAGLSTSTWTASMARRNPMSSTSWFTSTTIGQGLDTTAAQSGTPGYANNEVASASNLVVDPNSPTTLNDLKVTGTVIAAAGQTEAPFVTVRFTDLATNTVVEKETVVSAVDQSFSVQSGTLTDGTYRITAQTKDSAAFPNRSQWSTLQIPGSPQNVYVINATVVVIPTPVLNETYPKFVTTAENPMVTLTGTVASGGTLIISINGSNYSTTAVNPSQEFSIDVNLVPNSVNTIEVRAQDALGNTGDPAVATVTHDSIAPEVDGDNVEVVDNPHGLNDYVRGGPGSVEPGIIVEVYADAALTHKIGSAIAAADGSFGPIDIGNDIYEKVYILLRDPAGNMGTAYTAAKKYDGVGGSTGPITPLPTITVATSGGKLGATGTINPTDQVTIVTPTSKPLDKLDESGDVKSATDDAVARNWTPWIILAILIALAILATAGYFYWFGGEIGDDIDKMNSSSKEKPAPDRKDPKVQNEKKDKEKRW